MAKLSLAKLERHLYAAADILRREGIDAATYKDFIFGMLFLKRSNDVFMAARGEVVRSKVDAGMSQADAEADYGENPDYYDEFFVPSVARWPHIQDRLNDASVPFGSVLDQALVGLSQANSTLEHVLDHIHFMRVQGNKRVVSDDACKDLVRHFSRYRLRSEDFQFSDLLGSAYEFLINMFAESAGKKGGDFYTPRDVIRLMVRILNPTPGLSIYDPTCGSGGMLIISREYIEQSGGDATNLRLCGQVNDASAWSICKINMLLHGIRGADIQLQDTLLHPMHREAGELERFDRAIANPPFSQNYSRNNMEYPERFHWGWPPTSGKKGDLMFAQHMLATCKDRGMVCTVTLYQSSRDRRPSPSGFARVQTQEFPWCPRSCRPEGDRGDRAARRRSKGSQIFAPKYSRPTDAGLWKAPYADPWLSTNSHASQSGFVLAWTVAEVRDERNPEDRCDSGRRYRWLQPARGSGRRSHPIAATRASQRSDRSRHRRAPILRCVRKEGADDLLGRVGAYGVAQARCPG